VHRVARTRSSVHNADLRTLTVEMMRLNSLHTIVRVIADFAIYLWLCAKPSRNLAAENLFLRKQLALYKERQIKPRSTDPATRITMAFLSQRFDWRDALVIVQPRTLIRWHRQCYQTLWRNKSQAGRPPIPPELQQLIRRMANENITWGEERIANELLLKLGIALSPRTVRKYMPKRSNHQGPRGDQRWSTFLKNHASAIVACDFCVVVTANFRVLYAFVIIEHGSRRLIHTNVTLIQRPIGHASSFAKLFHQITNTDSYSMTVTVYSHQVLMKR